MANYSIGPTGLTHNGCARGGRTIPRQPALAEVLGGEMGEGVVGVGEGVSEIVCVCERVSEGVRERVCVSERE